MPNAMDEIVQQNAKAIDTSGIGTNTVAGLQMGMSLAQRQQQIEQARQSMQFQQQQVEMQKHDWLHSQLSSAVSENDPQIRKVLIDNMSDQFPKIFDGKRLDPATAELMKKSPDFVDKMGAVVRIRNAARSNNFSGLSDLDKGILNGMTNPDISSQLGHLNTMQNNEQQMLRALTMSRVATPQAAAAAGMSQEDLQTQMTASNPMMARVNSQQTLDAQHAVNKDPTMNAYKLRLDGASRVTDLITDAEKGKVKTNAAFLGQLNAEIARLETGSQSPGLGASEKTELVSAATQFEKMKERFSGKPTDAVSPDIIKQVKGTMESMTDSYMQAVDDRYGTISAGLTDIQKPIVKAKRDEDVSHYSKRFGHWAKGESAPEPGLAQIPPAQQAPPKLSPTDMESIEAQARERLRQAREAQKTGMAINFTEKQVKDTYKNLTGKDLQ